MRYLYLSIVRIKYLSGKTIEDKHLVYGYHKTTREHKKGSLEKIHEVLGRIRLPYRMSEEEVKKYCEHNKVKIMEIIEDVK